MTALEPTMAHAEGVRRAYKAFFTPPKDDSKPSQREMIVRGQTERVSFDHGQLAVTTWGDQERAVLLMHGWGGSRAQMTGFVAPLLAAGLRVVAYDQPAHGESDGTTTNILEIAPTMDIIVERYGHIDAIIAHSFGTLVSSFALVKRNFPRPQRLVYLGSYNKLLDFLPRFQALAGLSDEIAAGLKTMLYDNFGRDVLDGTTNASLVARIDLPALMFHDTGDEVAPIEDGRAIARAWGQAQLIETTGLGHRGALKSTDVQQQVARFLMQK